MHKLDVHVEVVDNADVYIYSSLEQQRQEHIFNLYRQ